MGQGVSHPCFQTGGERDAEGISPILVNRRGGKMFQSCSQERQENSAKLI